MQASQGAAAPAAKPRKALGLISANKTNTTAGTPTAPAASASAKKSAKKSAKSQPPASDAAAEVTPETAKGVSPSFSDLLLRRSSSSTPEDDLALYQSELFEAEQRWQKERDLRQAKEKEAKEASKALERSEAKVRGMRSSHAERVRRSSALISARTACVSHAALLEPCRARAQ